MGAFVSVGSGVDAVRVQYRDEKLVPAVPGTTLPLQYQPAGHKRPLAQTGVVETGVGVFVGSGLAQVVLYTTSPVQHRLELVGICPTPAHVVPVVGVGGLGVGVFVGVGQTLQIPPDVVGVQPQEQCSWTL